MTICITEAAAAHVRKMLDKRGKGEGLRLGVKKVGCAGMAYVLDFADSVSVDDRVYESHGVRVIVDSKSLPFLQGTEVDFVREGLNESFKFHNPNTKETCGCGESFSVG